MNWNESGLNEVLLRHFPGGTDENHEQRQNNRCAGRDYLRAHLLGFLIACERCTLRIQRLQISFKQSNITKINEKEKLSIYMQPWQKAKRVCVQRGNDVFSSRTYSTSQRRI
jgi:hypothetical protein